MNHRVYALAKKEFLQLISGWTGISYLCVGLFLVGVVFQGFCLGASPRYSSNVAFDFFYYTSGFVIVLALMVGARVISDETVLRTSPSIYLSSLSDREVVIGKFVGTLGFVLIFIFSTSYLPAIIFINGKVSIGHLLAGYIGLCLIGACVLSLSILGSSMSKTTMMSILCSSGLVFSLLIVWVLSLKFGEPYSGIFNGMALHNKHFPPFARGVIVVHHVGYYIVLTVVSLELSGVFVGQQREGLS